MDNNLTWHHTKVSKPDRERLNGHKGVCIWFTGLSGSGKSTLANELEALLYRRGIHTYLLDGDNIRHGLNKNLGFSNTDRKENIRRIGEVAKLYVDAGIIVITAFISPFKADRDSVRKLLEVGGFIEVYVDCDLSTCEYRDPKGLYKKARSGEIKEFTGISSPYEKPENPEVIIRNSTPDDLKSGVEKIIQYLTSQLIIDY